MNISKTEFKAIAEGKTLRVVTPNPKRAFRLEVLDDKQNVVALAVRPSKNSPYDFYSGAIKT